MQSSPGSGTFPIPRDSISDFTCISNPELKEPSTPSPNLREIATLALGMLHCSVVSQMNSAISLYSAGVKFGKAVESFATPTLAAQMIHHRRFSSFARLGDSFTSLSENCFNMSKSL
eukprot:Gregarina_sp_Poly_1__6037@NODE_3185_length_1292_cov_1_562449_g2022_i0_p1_GENE_NODE_3185_length_1292_cov_1_562449_g2022_i0NODE_3185_length_1292_cov_1_562449_g2022_i0_p1_ORF_typecomplete_len117_score10_05_NODE_3185_length_1292_cov_1_562449_g2022_i06771027